MDVVQTTIMVDQQVQPSADHLNRRLRPASDAPRKMEPFEQKLTVLGPQLHAEPCPRGHSLIVLPGNEWGCDRGKDEDRSSGLRLRAVDSLGISVIPGHVHGKVDTLGFRIAILWDGRDTSSIGSTVPRSAFLSPSSRFTNRH